MKKCYLLGQLDHEQKIIGVLTSSEPPSEMTKVARIDYVVLLQASGDSYGDALDTLENSYPEFMPRVAERFQFPR